MAACSRMYSEHTHATCNDAVDQSTVCALHREGLWKVIATLYNDSCSTGSWSTCACDGEIAVIRLF